MSEHSPLPPDVDVFLRRKLRSLTQLETLLLLRREPQTAQGVARALRISELHAEDELLNLVALRLASAEGPTYTFDASAKLRATIDTLDSLYPTYRVPISTAIFSKDDTRIRSFSDAFRLRGDSNK